MTGRTANTDGDIPGFSRFLTDFRDVRAEGGELVS
jgi:hypothetical protein